jgi:hypothetical protein
VRILFLLLTACLFIIACNRNNCGCVPPPYENDYLKATVTQTSNLDCGRPVISFDPSDTARAHQITGQRNFNFFVVKELSSELNIQNQKLWVLIDTLKASEEFVCTAMGSSFPHLKLLNALARE